MLPGARELSAYDLGTPPSGYERTPGSKKGSYRKRRPGGGYTYWYDRDSTAGRPAPAPAKEQKPQKASGTKPPGKRERARHASRKGAESLSRMVGQARAGGEIDLDEAARLMKSVSPKELMSLARSFGPVRGSRSGWRPRAREELRRLLLGRLQESRKVSLPPQAQGFIRDVLEDPGEDTLRIFADYLDDNDRPIAAAKLRLAFEMANASLGKAAIDPGRNSFPIWTDAQSLPLQTARFVQALAITNTRLPDGSRVWSHLSDEVQSLVVASRLLWAGVITEEQYRGVMSRARSRLIPADESIGMFARGTEDDRRHLRHIADETICNLLDSPRGHASWNDLARATIRDWPESFPGEEGAASWDDLAFISEMAAKTERLTGMVAGS